MTPEQRSPRVMIMMRRGASISRAPARRLTRAGCGATIAFVVTAAWSVAGSGDAAARSRAKPRPLNVAVRLAHDRSVHRTVGPKGATLVVNAKGVRYRLVIPSGAL